MDNKKTSLFISMLVQSNIVINTKGRSLSVACSFSIKRKRTTTPFFRGNVTKKLNWSRQRLQRAMCKSSCRARAQYFFIAVVTIVACEHSRCSFRSCFSQCITIKTEVCLYQAWFPYDRPDRPSRKIRTITQKPGFRGERNHDRYAHEVASFNYAISDFNRFYLQL